jgi:multifunctional 2-oxoglutarate metabolism enzyme
MALTDDFESLGPNSGLVEEMYRQFLDNPESVSESWRDFFADYAPRGAAAAAAPAPAPAAPVAPAAPAPAAAPAPKPAAPAGAPARKPAAPAGGAAPKPAPAPPAP